MEAPSSDLILRLQKLVRAGYVMQDSGTHDTIYLEHPARRRFAEWGIYLDENGGIRGWPRGDRQLKIPAGDRQGFLEFIASVPKPTWWQSFGDGRNTVLAVAIFCGGAFAFSWLIRQLWE